MEWGFNDGSKLVLDNLNARLLKFSINLFTGKELPSLKLSVQYGDNDKHYEVGSEVTGSLSTGINIGVTYKFKGYVTSMEEGTRTDYEIVLRPISYFSDLITDTYDSIKSALEEFEELDVKGTTSEGQVHGFGTYPNRLVDKLAPGYINGVFGRSYSKLIFREFKEPADFTPKIENGIKNVSITNSIYNKYLNNKLTEESADNHEIISGSGHYFSTNPDYNTYHSNVIKNTRFNYMTTATITTYAVLPFEPGMIINTSKMNQLKDLKLPKLMYVKSINLYNDGGIIVMRVTLAGDSKQ